MISYIFVGLICFLFGLVVRGLMTGTISVLLSVTKGRPALVRREMKGNDSILFFDDGSVYRGQCTVWHSYPFWKTVRAVHRGVALERGNRDGMA